MEGTVMKKLLFVALLAISTSAFAGMWLLIASDYQPGTGWICTYELSGTQYQATIISAEMCRQVITN